MRANVWLHVKVLVILVVVQDVNTSVKEGAKQHVGIHVKTDVEDRQSTR